MPLAFDPSSDAVPRTHQFVERAKAAVFSALTESGQQVQEHTEQLLSVPVERFRDAGGGTIEIRSIPGEAPRKDTGELQDNLQHLVERTPTGVEFTMTSGRPTTPGVPKELEDRMKRPYMGDQDPQNGQSSMHYAQQVIPEAIADQLRSLS